jgi:DNA invertase Pin-like site-specific DNA recombinase
MKRATIYARFSSDRQRDRSIDDQVVLCHALAARNGWRVVKIYTDYAVSGSTVHRRPEFSRMLADAEDRLFDVLIAEDIDRLARGEGDAPKLRQRLEFLGIDIHTCTDGHITKLHAGLKGLMGSLFLDNLIAHTRRGMLGRVREGLSAGGLTYGYAPGATKGERIIVEEEALVVQRIFEEYAAGRSPRRIAEGLNADAIKPPRGGQWLASTINGNSARGSGILQNTLYDGRMIWNRVSMHKDPDTGRRVSRPNLANEWVTTPVPHLRIVPAELFAKVQAIKTERGKARPERSHRPKHLLAGLLRCGCCGSAMVVNNVGHEGRRIYCGRRKEGGLCTNGKTYKLKPIEHRVVTALKAQLAEPRAIERYLKTYREERKRLAKENAGRRGMLERTLAQAKREVDRLVDGFARGIISDEEARIRLPQARHRRDAVQAELAALAPAAKVAELHPAALKRYLAAINDLAGALSRRLAEGDEEVATALRELIAAVVIHPAGKEEPKIEVAGRLAQLTSAPDLFPQQTLWPTVVAGAGIEPATYGL